MVRPARFADIPRLVDLVHEMYERSCYSDRAVKVDERETKSLLMNAIQRQGQKSRLATCVLVAGSSEAVTGFIVGIQEPVYHIGDANMATDLFFYNSPKGDWRDAGRLLDGFLKWAEGCPQVIEVRCGATDAISAFGRASALYERHGLRQCGVIFERVLGGQEPENQAEAAA